MQVQTIRLQDIDYVIDIDQSQSEKNKNKKICHKIDGSGNTMENPAIGLVEFAFLIKKIKIHLKIFFPPLPRDHLSLHPSHCHYPFAVSFPEVASPLPDTIFALLTGL